ncbi:MAG TPA: DUF1361 domain-containing protein [Candidatus Saccharimonadales bacterium]
MTLSHRELPLKSQFILALGLSTFVGVGLFFYSAALGHNYQYFYLLWNLLLAWIPLLLAFRLVEVLKRKPWSSWEALFISLLWIVFLPNSFYMISDFIHLQTAPPNQLVFYAITFTSIIYNAVVLGILSLYLIHVELKKRLSSNDSALAIALTILICCVAIYIGRDLRWNSWDVLTNPGGIIFELTDQLFNFSFYRSAISMISAFFVLIGSMYILAWSGIKLVRRK